MRSTSPWLAKRYAEFDYMPKFATIGTIEVVPGPEGRALTLADGAQRPLFER
jgi:hypothetical protein